MWKVKARAHRHGVSRYVVVFCTIGLSVAFSRTAESDVFTCAKARLHYNQKCYICLCLSNIIGFALTIPMHIYKMVFLYYSLLSCTILCTSFHSLQEIVSDPTNTSTCACQISSFSLLYYNTNLISIYLHIIHCIVSHTYIVKYYIYILFKCYNNRS